MLPVFIGSMPAQTSAEALILFGATFVPPHKLASVFFTDHSILQLEKILETI